MARDHPENVLAYLRTASERVRFVHDRLVEAGLDGVYAKYLAGADEHALGAFFQDLDRVDMQWVVGHRTALLSRGTGSPVASLEPVEPGSLDGRDNLVDAGLQSLAAGEWAVVVFAGGAATRFFGGEPGQGPGIADGRDRHPPKALVPVTPVGGWSFLDLFAAQVLEAGLVAGKMPYLVLMTSSITADAIGRWARGAIGRDFPREYVILVPQGENPRLDHDGDLLAAPDGHLLFTGNGHGGIYKALLEHGPGRVTPASVLRSAGVKSLVLHNVDNAAANALEPARLGFHVTAGKGMTISAVRRERPDEKVGLVAFNKATQRVEVVEYSVCPKEISGARDSAGGPRFALAHISTNLVDLDLLRPDIPPTLYTGKVVSLGERRVESSTWEMLNQDLSRLLDARRVGVLLLDRERFFLPTKNKVGPASLETTRDALASSGRALLRAAGARVDDRAVVEAAPCLGGSPGALRKKGVGPGWVIHGGAKVFLGVVHGAHGYRPFGEGLVVGRDAVLVVDSDHPHGAITVDPTTRAVRADPGGAGMISLGKGVSIAPGAHVELRADWGARIVVAGGSVLEGEVKIHARSGESLSVGTDGGLA